MASDFLSTLLHVVQFVTEAERFMTVNDEMQVQEILNLDVEVLESEAFQDFAVGSLQQALSENSIVTTNNIISDPSEAPKTNMKFQDLRFVAVIPVAGYGAIYMDQQVRQGVIPKDILENVLTVAEQFIAQGQTDCSAEEMLARYREITGEA